MDICQKDDQCVKYTLNKSNQNIISELPQNMLTTLMYMTAQNYLKNPMETNTHILYQLSYDKFQQKILTNEEQLLMLCFIFADKDFLNIVDIKQLNDLIDLVFNNLDDEQFQVYVQLLKNSIIYICQNYMTPELVINITIKLLNAHYQNQPKLEDTRTIKPQKCISIWNIIEGISEFITDFQQQLNLNDILYGIILPLNSKAMPISLHVKLQDQKQILEKRDNMYNLTLQQINPQLVDSLYDIQSYQKLLLGQQVSQIENLQNIKLIQLILERFIQSVILDFNQEHQNAGLQAITQIIENLGMEYKNRIGFMIEIHRIKELPKLPYVIYYICDRIIEAFDDMQQYQSYLELIFEKNKLENNVQNGQALLIRMLSSICKYIPYQSQLFQNIVQFIEETTQEKCKINSHYAHALQSIWNNILYDKNYDIEMQLKLNDIIIKNQDEYVLNYLIPRYQDTIQYSNQDYPSICHCLSGIICQRGTSYLLKECNVIENLILKLIRNDIINQKIQGLIILYDVMQVIKQLFDPYIKIVTGDLIILHQVEDQQVQELIQLCIDQILQNVSQFGLFQLVKIIDFSLQQQDSSEMIIGGLEIVLQILKNKGKISLSSFRQIVQKLLPDVLPLLQDLISHENRTIANKTQEILLISVDQITNGQIKTMGKRIIECYNYQSYIRNLLSDFNEIVFQNKIDKISLILLVPLCLKIMNQTQVTLYASAGDKSQNLHIKQIAATSLAILSQVSSQHDFEQFLDKIINSLINNLNDTNDDIRNSCVNSLIKVVGRYQQYSIRLTGQLIQQIKQQDNVISIAERKGKIQAIVGLSYLIQQQQQLLDLLQQDPLNGLLITFYLPQYVIQNIYNNSECVELKQQFNSIFFNKLVEQLFVSVQQLKDDQQNLIIKSARQLFTSFAREKQIVQQSINQIIKYILHPNEKIRQICIILVGDIMSEIGSEAQGTIKESEEIQNVKKLLSQVYVSGIAEAKTKVFIPEKSIAYAVQQIGQQNYDNLCSCIFILKCESDDDVRRQAVNMWKLITYKPQIIIDRFYNELLNNMIISQQNGIIFEEKTIESYILQAHKQSMNQLNQAIINKLQEAINDTNNNIALQLLNLLGIISEQYEIEQSQQLLLFQLIPTCLKVFTGDNQITSSAMSILCNQENNEDQIRQIIQPQLDQISQLSTVDQIQKLVEQISIVIYNNNQLIQNLIKEFMTKGEEDQNYYIFISLLIIHMSDNQNIEDWIYQIIKVVQQKTQNIQQMLNQQNTKQIQQIISKKQFEYYDKSLQVIKMIYTSENQEIIKLTNELLCQNVITNVIEDQISNTLMLCIGMFYQYQNVQVISSILQATFTNVQKQSYGQIFSIVLSALYAQYKHLQSNSVELEAYIELILQQIQNYMYGIVNAQVFLEFELQVQDLITLLCTIQSYVQKDDKNYFAQSKMVACNIFIQLILTTLQTYRQQQQLKVYDDYIFLNTNYKISQDKKCTQANKYAVGMIGRIVLLIKQQTIVQSSYLQIIELLAKYIDIHQFEQIIKGEIEKYCLINSNKQIEEISSSCLIYLFRQSSKPLNSIDQLIKRITREIIEGNNDIQTQIQALQQYITYSHPQLQKLEDIQKIQDLIQQLPKSTNQQINEQLVKLSGIIIDKLLAVDPLKAELLLYDQCFQKTTTIEEECKQLIILSSLFQYCQPQQLDKMYKLVAHCLENLQTFDESREKISLTQLFTQRLDNVITAQQTQVVVRIAQVVTNVLQVYTQKDIQQNYSKINKQFIFLFGKCIQVCQKYEQTENYDYILQCIRDLSDLEDPVIKRTLGLITMQFINDCFMNQETFQETQNTAIQFYRLRYDKSFVEEVFQVLQQSNIVLVEQMKQRINQISKAIKQGKL